MSPRQLIIATLAVLPAISGCSFLGRCNYETRSAHAAGSVTENGAELASAMARVGARRGSSNDRHFSFDLTSYPLEGHIVSVALTDATRPGVVVLELPFIVQFHPAIIRGDLEQLDDAPTPALGGIYELVQSNRAVLEVRTDLPDRPLVRIPLTVTFQEDWSRPYCS